MQNRLKPEQYAFIRYLTALGGQQGKEGEKERMSEEKRGALAVLRRGLRGNPIEDLNLYRFVTRRIPDYDRGTPRESVYYLTAALFGLHPINADEGNFGAHLKAVALARKDEEAAERRFTALLNARLEDLASPLRQAVSMLDLVPVNWMQLFCDLLHWQDPSKRSQRAWANSFWAFERPAADQPNGQPTNQPVEISQGE